MNYRTSAFFKSVFKKFNIDDPSVQKQIITIYGKVVSTILEAPENQRIVLFKKLTELIKDTAKDLSSKSMKVAKASTEYICFLINALNKTKTSRVFEDIMKQVNIDEIACDIGQCVSEYKKTKDKKKRRQIKEQLQSLIDDYNMVTKSSLSIDKVLKEVREDEKQTEL